jgi:hypothetical protein
LCSQARLAFAPASSISRMHSILLLTPTSIGEIFSLR